MALIKKCSVFAFFVFFVSDKLVSTFSFRLRTQSALKSLWSMRIDIGGNGMNVKNFRSVIPDSGLPIYRCAALDEVSSYGVDYILHELKVGSILDLRNKDEIFKGYDLWRFKGAFDLYGAFKIIRFSNENSTQTNWSPHGRSVFQLPLLDDPVEFWTTLKNRMVKDSNATSFQSLINSIVWNFDSQSLSKLLIEYLSQGGLPLLYSAILESSMPKISTALNICLSACESAAAAPNDNTINTTTTSTVAGSVPTTGVIIHCAQGKDRTGLVAMLLEFALCGDNAETEERVLRNYEISSALLGEGKEEDDKNASISKDAESSSQRKSASTQIQQKQQPKKEEEEEGYQGLSQKKAHETARKKKVEREKYVAKTRASNKVVRMGDIASLQGSPREAMAGTLERLRGDYGSVDGYLDRVGFDRQCRERLRRCAEKLRPLPPVPHPRMPPSTTNAEAGASL